MACNGLALGSNRQGDAITLWCTWQALVGAKPGVVHKLIIDVVFYLQRQHTPVTYPSFTDCLNLQQ